jgi:ubiquinone/menaquinone biosynthesis C-methylase UbiE
MSMPPRVDYDKIAPTFDARFTLGLYDGVLAVLRSLVRTKRPQFVLEAGCGTGYWLSALRDIVPRIYGIDHSLEMLRKASDRNLSGIILQATAGALPFRDCTFDLILCVNAIHHFEEIDDFVMEARRLLGPGGALTIIGMDPHHGHDYWCIYDYFPATKATDLARYPSSGQIADAMFRAGFACVESRVACRFGQTRVGPAIFQDPELQRRGCSQMALLTDEQYAAGIERINSAIRFSKSDEPPVFKVDIAMMMHCGCVAA